MEGGIRGLVIVFSAFMIQVLAMGNYASVGIYTVHLLDAFDNDVVGVSLISSIHFATLLCCGPLASFLMTKLTYRTLCLSGAALVCIGIFCTPLLTYLPAMYIFFGVFAGLGGCLIYLPSHVLSGLYYDKHRSLSTGVATAGTGMGAIIMPLVVGVLIEEYTWKGSLMILAGIDMHLFIFALLMRPPPPKRMGSMKVCSKQSVPHDDDDVFTDADNAATDYQICETSDFQKQKQLGGNHVQSKNDVQKQSTKDIQDGLSIYDNINENRSKRSHNKENGGSCLENKERIFLQRSCSEKGARLNSHHSATENRGRLTSHNSCRENRERINSHNSFRGYRERSNSQRSDTRRSINRNSRASISSFREAAEQMNAIPDDDISWLFIPSYFAWSHKRADSVRGRCNSNTIEENNAETAILNSTDSLSPEGSDKDNEDDIESRSLVSESKRTHDHSNVKEHLKKHLYILSDCKFIIYFISTIMWSMTVTLFITFGPELIVLKGHEAVDTAFVFTFYGVGQTVGCIFISIVGNFFGKRMFLYIASNFFTGAFMILMPIFNSFEELAVVLVCNGLAYGGLLGLYMIVMVDLLGPEDMDIGLGYVLLASGVGCFAGPPLGGVLSQLYGSYDEAFYSAGVLTMFAGLIMLFVYLPRCRASQKGT